MTLTNKDLEKKGILLSNTLNNFDSTIHVVHFMLKIGNIRKSSG